MNSLLIINWLAAIAVIAYAGYLFVYLIRTRMAYIQLGKKIEFDRRFKERWDLLKVNVFGQKKLLKDKRAALFTLCSFTDLFLSNLEQLTSFGKDSHQDHIFHLTTIPCIYILPGNCHTCYFNCSLLGFS